MSHAAHQLLEEEGNGTVSISEIRLLGYYLARKWPAVNIQLSGCVECHYGHRRVVIRVVAITRDICVRVAFTTEPLRHQPRDSGIK